MARPPGTEARGRRVTASSSKTRPLLIYCLCECYSTSPTRRYCRSSGRSSPALTRRAATAMMSACIVAAQLVMLPIALWSGAKPTAGGASHGFSRLRHSTNSRRALHLLGQQLGLAEVIADIMRGTGRYNLAQGAIATMVRIGASVSKLATGEVVDHLSYSAAFLTLGAVALAAVTVFAVAMPEPANSSERRPLLPATAYHRRLNVPLRADILPTGIVREYPQAPNPAPGVNQIPIPRDCAQNSNQRCRPEP